MNLIRSGKNIGFSPVAIAPVEGLAKEQIERVFHDIESKRRFARYLRAPSVLLEDTQAGSSSDS